MFLNVSVERREIWPLSSPDFDIYDSTDLSYLGHLPFRKISEIL